MKDKPGYWAVIPATVRYSDLKPNAKLLYGEITALQGKEGYCFASNKYFAELYKVTKNTASTWINDLKKKGFVKIQIIKEGGEVIERRISTIEKEDTPTNKNQEYNNTSNNNTINKLPFRRKQFFEDIAILYNEKILNDEQSKNFFLYWSETNRSQTKMRFEMEKTWNLKARMQRWASRQKQWNPKKSNNLKTKLDTFNKAKQMINQINNR